MRRSYPGTGSVGEPAFVGSSSTPAITETIGQPDSVCHQWSITGTFKISSGSSITPMKVNKRDSTTNDMVAPNSSRLRRAMKTSMARTLRWYIKGLLGPSPPMARPDILRHNKTDE